MVMLHLLNMLLQTQPIYLNLEKINIHRQYAPFGIKEQGNYSANRPAMF